MLSHQFGFDIKDEDISMYQGERLYNNNNNNSNNGLLNTHGGTKTMNYNVLT